MTQERSRIPIDLGAAESPGAPDPSTIMALASGLTLLRFGPSFRLTTMWPQPDRDDVGGTPTGAACPPAMDPLIDPHPCCPVSPVGECSWENNKMEPPKKEPKKEPKEAFMGK